MKSPDLFPFQQVGVDWLRAHKRGMLLDEMGLGKSAQAISALGDATAIVICPAVMRRQWANEFALWTGTPAKPIYTAEDLREPARVRVLSYHGAVKLRDELSKMRFERMVLDEAHLLKEREATRTRVIYGRGRFETGLAQSCGGVWAMSGTLLPNNVSELFTHLAALFPDALDINGKRLDFIDFVRRYCVTKNTPYGIRVIGQKNTAELKASIAPYMLRRRISQVMPELPPMFWSDYTVDPGREARDTLKKYESHEEYAALRSVIDHALGLGNLDEVDLEFALKFMPQSSSTQRRLVGLAKVPPVLEVLRHDLDSDEEERKVIFCQHRETMALLAEGLDDFGVVQVHGDHNDDEREAAVNAFQRDGSARVFIGQIDTANAGLTLTAATRVEIVEPSWVPSVNWQAAMRVRRIGQTKPTFARMWGLAGSIDEAITRVLLRKTRHIAAVLD